MVGQKYARNARTACKKLFDKLKANAPADAQSTVTPGPSGEDGEDDEPPKKSSVKAAAKKTAPAKGAAKKGVGKATAPRKAGKGGPKAAAKGKNAKVVKSEEVVKNEDEDEEDEDEEMAEADNDGKSLNSSHLAHANGNGISLETAAEVSGDWEDRHMAAVHHMTLEEWTRWKEANNYDNIAPTPERRTPSYASDDE